MKSTDDEKLLMIYFNEAQQHDIDQCLSSSETCEQLDQLEADMNAIETAQNQDDLPADYGQQLWHQIADKLVPVKPRPKQAISSWFQQLRNIVLLPQYSLASFTAVITLVVLALYTGRNQNNEIMGTELQELLLAQNIQLHLTQSEIFLTQVSNDNGSYNSQATAQRLLSSNRIFKQALANHEGQFTNQLLQNLEPVLLEYANGTTPDSSDQTHGKQPQANWVSDSKSNDLMFQIKAMKQKLAQKNDII